jgi:hypothetical protein
VCNGCGTILQFDRQLNLSAMTPAQIERLPPNSVEELRQEQERWRERTSKVLA